MEWIAIGFLIGLNFFNIPKLSQYFHKTKTFLKLFCKFFVDADIGSCSSMVCDGGIFK